jgi:TP901 family phage tail tape measure protein
MAAADLNLMLNIQLSQQNLRNVNNDLSKGVGPIDLKVNAESKNIAKIKSEINSVSTAADKGRVKAESFADVVTLKGRGFAAYAIASAAIAKLTGAIAGATREAFKLEVELIKIAQVTNRSTSDIKANTNAVLQISKTYGVAATKVAGLIRVLTQTGLSFKEASKAAETLARTSLLASFDNLQSTTEGLVAIMNSFKLSTEEASKGLEVINVLAKNFAVESGDIVEAVKRTGGAFKAAGGSLNELAVLLTAVRSTTRETAETISTAFRTIFGRLQRPKTIQYFKELNIELSDAAGNFIGPVAAIKEITKGLDRLGISAGSIRFAEVVEQIGGIRQLSKVVPLLTEGKKIQEALSVANQAEAESTKDVEKAKESLSQKLAELTTNFRALFVEVADSVIFQQFARLLITLGDAAINLARSLKPVIPLLATFAAFKIGKSVFSAFKFIKSGGLNTVSSASEALGFNRGGPVPGSGSGDTVPAMLEPGEFVIRKRAVQAYGADKLAGINKYAKGGMVGIKSVKSTGNAFDGDTIGVEITPNEEPFDTRKTRLLGWDAYEMYKGTQQEKDKAVKARELADREYGKGKDLTKQFKSPKNQGTDKFNRFFWEDKAFGKKLEGAGLAIPYNGSGKRATKMAKGGSVGTDTVPALLTPGEFVVNQKSAKAYGYGKLGEINKYAKGGVVRGFEDGGLVPSSGSGSRTSKEQAGLTKAIEVLTKAITEDNKQLELLDFEADELAQQLQKLEQQSQALFQSRAEGGKASKALTRIDNIRAQREDQLNAVLEKRAKTEAGVAAKSGERTKAIGQAKSAKEINTLTNKTGSPDGSVREAENRAVAEGVKIKSRLNKEEVKVVKKAGLVSKAFNSVADNALGITTVVAGLKAGLEAFGVELANSAAANRGISRSATLSSAGEGIGQAAEGAGAQLESWGDRLGKSKSKFAKFGKGLGKSGKFLSKFGQVAAKGLKAAGLFELAGGVLAGFLTTDYDKIKQEAIERGNADAAGAAASRAYSQAQLAGIPIIGSFLSIIDEFSPGLFSNMFGQDQDSQGRRNAVATAKLAASNVKLVEINEKLNKTLPDAFRQAGKTGNFSAVGKVLGPKLDELSKRNDLARGIKDDRANILGGGDITKQALAGAAAGGAIGAVSGGGLFSAPAALVGAGLGLVTGAISGWFTQSSKLAENIDNLKEKNEALSKNYEEYASIVEKLGPTFDVLAAQTAQAGGDIEEFYKRINAAGLGGAAEVQNEEGLVRSELNVKSIDKKIAAEEQKLSKETNKDKRAVISSTIKSLATEKKVEETRQRTFTQNKARVAQQQENIKLIKALNQAYFAQAEQLRALNKEATALTIGEQKLSAARSQFDFAVSGQQNEGTIRKSLGTDITGDNIQQIIQAGDQDKLLKAADRAGDATSIGVRESIRRAEASKGFDTAGIGTGVFTEGTASVKATDVVEKLFPGFKNGDPVTKAIAEGYQKEIEAALRGDVAQRATKLESIKKKYLEENKDAVDNAKKAADLQTRAEIELQSVNKKLNEVKLQIAQNEFNTTQKLAKSKASLADEELNALSRAGLSDKEVLKRRKKNNAEEQKRIEKELSDLKTSSTPTTAAGAEVDKSKSIIAGAGNKEVSDRTEQQAAKAAEQAQDKNNITLLQDQNQAIKKGIDIIQQENEARMENAKAMQAASGALAEDLAFGSDEARESLLQDANLAATALSRGSMSGFSGEQRGQVQGFLDRFTGLGGDLGKNARAAKGRLGAQELFEQGVITKDQIQKTADDIANADLPINQAVQKGIEDGYAKIAANEKQIINLENKANQDLIFSQTALNQSLIDLTQVVKNAGGIKSTSETRQKRKENQSKTVESNVIEQKRTALESKIQQEQDARIQEDEAFKQKQKTIKKVRTDDAAIANANFNQAASGSIPEFYRSSVAPNNGPLRPQGRTTINQNSQRLEESRDSSRATIQNLQDQLNNLPPKPPQSSGGGGITATSSSSGGVMATAEHKGDFQIKMNIGPEFAGILAKQGESIAFSVMKEGLSNLASQITPTMQPSELKAAIETVVNLNTQEEVA